MMTLIGFKGQLGEADTKPHPDQLAIAIDTCWEMGINRVPCHAVCRPPPGQTHGGESMHGFPAFFCYFI